MSVAPGVEGYVDDRFASVAGLLAQNLESGEDLGASVCVIHQGRVVCDIWGGYRDPARITPWDRDTIVNVWSTTKTMTFLVALMLCDRGDLDFDAPVARYWPEFAQQGKDGILVRHIMAHSAGLSGFEGMVDPEELADWDSSTARLAAQRPWWSDRSVSGYHAVTQGHLIGEIVRRITGVSIGTFFKHEVANVLGADFHIGLPDDAEDRVSLVVAPEVDLFSRLPHDSVAYRALSSPRLDPTSPHHRWWRAAEIPAANGHGNARSVAAVQEIIANNGHAGGHRFFRESTGQRIFELQTSGIDQVLGVEMNYGMGYGLASATVPMGPRSCFWGGFGGSTIVMDQELGLTVAYMMNQMRVGLIGDTRGPSFVMAAALAAMA